MHYSHQPRFDFFSAKLQPKVTGEQQRKNGPSNKPIATMHVTMPQKSLPTIWEHTEHLPSLSLPPLFPDRAEEEEEQGKEEQAAPEKSMAVSIREMGSRQKLVRNI